MSDWRAPSEIGDVAYADYLVQEGIPADDVIVQALRKRARPPEQIPLSDILRRELKARGWKEAKLKGHRVAREWKHESGETAFSLTDALVKQLMREIR